MDVASDIKGNQPRVFDLAINWFDWGDDVIARHANPSVNFVLPGPALAYIHVPPGYSSDHLHDSILSLTALLTDDFSLFSVVCNIYTSENFLLAAT